MKYFFVCFILLATAGTVQAQEQTAALLQETAKTLIQKGDFDNAVIVLDRAQKQEPENIDILRDLCFANYLKRDFAKAIEVGKELVEKPNADAQSFQVLGLAYKAIASYKECGKMYREALKKFPKSGVLYNENGELYALDNDLKEAIVQWEKGIELDPGYSSNYYNAAMYYVRTGNWIRAALYGETFMNLESYTTRAEDMKAELFTAYKKLLNPAEIQKLQDAKTSSAFEKNVLTLFAKAAVNAKADAGVDELIGIRTRFIIEWTKEKSKTYPFRLFDQQQYLLSQGLFSAYNYWLFSTSMSAETYQVWEKNNKKEAEGFKTFQQSRVFKIPAGEYYFAL
jgi:tetratricopeptide (TPR) repeat protein